MMTVTRFAPDGKSLVLGGEELLPGAGPLWVDVQHPTPEEMQRLAERFTFHRLAVEDALHLDQRPKLEEYPGHLFLVLHGFAADRDELCRLTLHEMHFFLGSDWLVTVHELASEAVEVARRRLTQDPQGTLGRGLDFVGYLVADALVDQNFPILDRFSDELEDLETQIVELPDQAQMIRIFELKRSLVTLRRVLSPQRDVVGMLSRRGLSHVNDRTTLYFRDVYDHLIRLYEQIESGRDLLGNAMDAYMSMMANRTNDVTKQLTIFATIFLPLSFITGFFGQNFDVLSAKPLLYVMLVSVFGLPIGLMYWFHWKRWI